MAIGFTTHIWFIGCKTAESLTEHKGLEDGADFLVAVLMRTAIYGRWIQAQPAFG